MPLWSRMMGSMVLGTVLVIAQACTDNPVGVDEVEPPAGLPTGKLLWDLLYSCPECEKRLPMDTEAVVIDEALMMIDSNCLDSALGDGAYEWLETQVMLGNIGVDLDVMTLSEWDYARGYWVAPSLRYQYWGRPLYVAQPILNDDDKLEVARTLAHETGHEYGLTEDDEALAESIARLCT